MGQQTSPATAHTVQGTATRSGQHSLHHSPFTAERPAITGAGLRSVLLVFGQDKSVDGLCIWLMRAHIRVQGREG
jgi:hypothetical protein